MGAQPEFEPGTQFQINLFSHGGSSKLKNELITVQTQIAPLFNIL